MTSTTYITLNLQAPNTAVTVNAKQNDRLSRYISAALYDGSVTFVPPVGASAAIRYKNPDGTGGFYDADEDANPAIVITGSTALLTLAEQCTTVPGDVYMELNFYTAAGDKLTSFTWLLKVEQSVLTDATIVSSDYYNVLTAAIATTLEYRDAAATSATAAQTAQTAAEAEAAAAAASAALALQISQQNKGWYPSATALTAAHPTGQNGDWALVGGDIDTIWMWDSDSSAWKNTHQQTDLSNYYTKTQADDKFVPPAESPTENNFAALTADGKIKDSGKKASDFSEWKSITVPTPSVSGNVRTYTFDMTGKNENEIGVQIFANGYSALDMKILPAPYAFAYSVSYQDNNLTSRTIVTGSISGENLTIAVNSYYLSTVDAYSVISMFLWR